MTRLDNYDRHEWWDVCRRLSPSLTEDQFDILWEGFQLMKDEYLRAEAKGKAH